ncbi:MAG: hypothetical protein AAFO69_02750 [Bacteroidota bacterium]
MQKEVKQLITILEKQLVALDEASFDLEAWKAGAIARLNTIYPEDSIFLAQLQDIKIDYSSWALRDSSASYKPVDSCRKIGRTVIEAVIDDLTVFGLPESRNGSESGAVLSKVEKSKRADFEKLMENPQDKAFHKHLMELTKRELSDLVVVLMSKEEE